MNIFKKAALVILSVWLIGMLFTPAYVYAQSQNTQGAPQGNSQTVTGETPQPFTLIKPRNLPGPAQSLGSGTDQASPFGSERLKQYLTGETGFVARYLPGFLGFIAIATVFVIIVGGIMFLTAFGNEEKLGTAKKVVQWAIVGLVLAMFAYAIVNIILRLPLPGT